jgi:hypothetical protein
MNRGVKANNITFPNRIEAEKGRSMVLRPVSKGTAGSQPRFRCLDGWMRRDFVEFSEKEGDVFTSPLTRGVRDERVPYQRDTTIDESTFARVSNLKKNGADLGKGSAPKHALSLGYPAHGPPRHAAITKLDAGLSAKVRRPCQKDVIYEIAITRASTA